MFSFLRERQRHNKLLVFPVIRGKCDCGLRIEEKGGGGQDDSAENYPWESPRADLEAAEKLINDCGYHRRDEELADAKRAILGE